jgi:hypothetical protein
MAPADCLACLVKVEDNQTSINLCLLFKVVNLYNRLNPQWHDQSGYWTIFADMETIKMFHPIKAWLSLQICDEN